MKRYGKAEGKQTDSRTAGCPKTDWQVGDRIIQYKQALDIQRSGKRQTYKRQVVDRHTYGNRQTSGKRQQYTIMFDHLQIIKIVQYLHTYICKEFLLACSVVT
jgi:hypothetical protein